MRAATLMLALAAALPSAFATPYTTSPVSSSVWQAGVTQTVQWIEDPNNPTPALKDYGPCKISIYVGNSQQQTSLQLIAPSVDVSKNGSVQFIPDPKIGPDSDQYFIRIESLALKDPKNPQYPALAFSAKFQLTGMTGNFTTEEQNQINGASSLPLGGSSSSPSSTSTRPSSSPSSAPPKTSGTPSSSVRPSSTGSTQGSTGGAPGLAVGKLLTGVVAVAAGLAVFL